MPMTSTERSRASRARRKAAAQAADASTVALRDAATLLAPSVAETIAALGLGKQDAAAAQLAQQLARQVDQAADQSWALRWLSPHLLDVLVQLGATPAARSRLKGQPASRGPSRLDELRAARGWHLP
jgi:hypothetical protein